MAWVPGTSGEIRVPLVDLGAPPSNDWTPPADRVRGAAVLVDVRAIGNDPAFVMRSVLARKLAEAGAAAMLLPSDKPGRMVYTSAFGFYPKGPLPAISVAKEDALLLRRLLAKGPVSLALDVKNTFDTTPYNERNVVADLPGGAGEGRSRSPRRPFRLVGSGAGRRRRRLGRRGRARRRAHPEVPGSHAAAHNPVRVLLGRGGRPRSVRAPTSPCTRRSSIV